LSHFERDPSPLFPNFGDTLDDPETPETEDVLMRGFSFVTFEKPDRTEETEPNCAGGEINMFAATFAPLSRVEVLLMIGE
jgi:hypothetical protein